MDIKDLYTIDLGNGVFSSLIATFLAFLIGKIFDIDKFFIKLMLFVGFLALGVPLINYFSGNLSSDAAKVSIEEAKIKYEAAISVQAKANNVINEAVKASESAVAKHKLAEMTAAEAEEKKQQAEKTLADANAKKQLADKTAAEAEEKKQQAEKALADANAKKQLADKTSAEVEDARRQAEQALGAAKKRKKEADKNVEEIKNAYLEPVFGGPNSKINVPK